MSDTAEALIAFLNARLDEKEAAAKAALHGGSGHWVRSGNGDLVDADREEMMWVIPAGKTTDAELAHIALNDPGRALREVEAMRAMIRLADEATDLDLQVDQEFRVGLRDEAAEPLIGEVMLRTLAAIWSDHPDYDKEWAP